MKNNYYWSALITLFLILSLFPFLHAEAQVQDIKSIVLWDKEKETDKGEKELIMLSSTEYLVNTRQFVFEADYGEGSYEVFILVDTTMGMVQSGIRNNLEGRISQFEVKKNVKKKTISVSIKIKGKVGIADVFLLVGASGHGSGSIRSNNYDAASNLGTPVNESPGDLNFDGQLRSIDQARIYKAKSHLIH